MNHYVIQIKSKVSGKTQTITLEEGSVKEFKSILDLRLRHEEQISILKKIQDAILK